MTATENESQGREIKVSKCAMTAKENESQGREIQVPVTYHLHASF